MIVGPGEKPSIVVATQIAAGRDHCPSPTQSTSGAWRPTHVIRALQPVLMACAALWLAACAPAPKPVAHEAYVWQRVWTSAVVDAVKATGDQFVGLRVLGLQVTGHQRIAPSVDLRALADSGLPIRLVIRIEGSRPTPDTTQIADWANTESQRWLAAGVNLTGVEIDHDCATAGLADYARWHQRFRTALDPGLRVSITALPAWIASSELPRLLATIDDSVLQVHALDRAADDLIDTAQSLQWLHQYDQLSPKDFRIALPAYSLRVGLDASGAVRSVDAEGAQDVGNAAAQERHSPPLKVAALLAQISRADLTHFRGVIWFRLPVAGDRRAWSRRTLATVIAGKPLTRGFQLRATGATDARDLLLFNTGNADAAPPSRISLPTQCASADALQHYSIDVSTAKLVLRSHDNAWLRSGESWRIAWARCEPPLNADWSLDVSHED